MSSRTPIADSPSVIETLREIQRREGRNSTDRNVSDNYDRRITCEIVPWYEAPVGVSGMIRLRQSDGKMTLRGGTRCVRCPRTGACSCFNPFVPVQFLMLPPGWLTQI